MATNNAGHIAISSEDKPINTKQSEIEDKNQINTNTNNIDKNIINNNNQEDIEELPPYYRLFIYSDSGSCIYKAKTKNIKKQNNNEFYDEDLENDGVDKDLGAIEGIIQAIFFSPMEIKCELHMISTDVGLLAYKAFNFEDHILLLALIFPNYYSDETLSHRISQLLLNYIFHFLLMNIGKKSLFKFSNSKEIEKLRKLIEVYNEGIHHILNNHSSLTFLLKAEKKLQLEKDVIYGIKYYLENLKKSIKTDFICLTIENSIVWASPDWLSINIMDRILFLMISEIYCENDFHELPIYFTRTQLEDEGLGINPYKLIVINLMKDTKLIIISDNELELENIDFSSFDDYFMSKITTMNKITKFNNDILDTYLKGAVVHNKFLKTYKIMGDEELKEVYENFLINNVFTNYMFDNDGECMSDQFYVKDNRYFIFYYYRINALCFLLLFDKETSFDDINAVTSTLKALKDSFDNRENYKESNEGNNIISKKK